MKFIDSHAHLQDPRLHAQLPDLLERSSAAGIDAIVCCGCRESDWEAVAELSLNHSSIIPFFGLHPWYLNELSDQWSENLKGYLTRFPSAGVGEIGVDGKSEAASPEVQAELFSMQLEIASDLGRPVSIHCLKSWQQLLYCLEADSLEKPRFMIHAFSGAPEMVKTLSAMGAYFSFGAALTFNNAKRARTALVKVPADRLLFETDSPDMLPAGKSGEMNEPAFMTETVSAAARILGESADTLAERVYENSRTFFGLKNE